MFAEREIGTRMIHNIQLLGIASSRLRVCVYDYKGIKGGREKEGRGERRERDRDRDREK